MRSVTIGVEISVGSFYENEVTITGIGNNTYDYIPGGYCERKDVERRLGQKNALEINLTLHRGRAANLLL